MPDLVVPALPASTVLVVREGPRGPEVLMLKRSASASFMGGVWVFPGGGVDERDATEAAWRRVVGLDDAAASAALGLDSGGLAFYVAALREVFEESGLLLAVDAQGQPVGPGHAARLAEHRRALNAGEADFAAVLEDLELALDLSAVGHHAHWITPTAEVKRFDTYFFCALAPEGQAALHDESETVDSIWTTPADALERHRAGEVHMVLPTLRNLAFVAEHASAADVVAASKATSHVPTILPKMVAEEDGHTLLVPGDPGYEDAEALANDPKAFGSAARRRAVRENPPRG
jgi:8-oxo-dGTP pyrophosphatase MutT (NUDIX family)